MGTVIFMTNGGLKIGSCTREVTLYDKRWSKGWVIVYTREVTLDCYFAPVAKIDLK